jgi:hypothetical protein
VVARPVSRALSVVQWPTILLQLIIATCRDRLWRSGCNQLADIFTQILDQKTFIEIRDKLMHHCPG